MQPRTLNLTETKGVGRRHRGGVYNRVDQAVVDAATA